MSEYSAFRKCSEMEVSAMNMIAADARDMVRAAAEPVRAGETVRAQMRRAAKALGYKPEDWRLKAAWYGEAGCWGAATYCDLQRRYRDWKASNEERAERAIGPAVAALLSLRRQYLAQADQEFYRSQVAGVDAALARMGVDVGALVGTEAGEG